MAIISKFYKIIAKDSLYRNSIYLMLSTVVMSVLGFFFWIINARVYTTEQVGIGTALISVVTLISSFSILGLGSGLIRYLPTSERKNKKINTAFTIIALMSILISVIYLIFIRTFSPKLLFVRENIIFSLLFIITTVVSSLNIISENVFIAYRTTKFVLIKNTISSIVKLILTIFLVALGAYGIFLSVGIAMTIAVIFIMIFLVLRFNYSLKPAIDITIVKKMTIYSLGNYAAGLIAGLPGTVLPILIINFIDAKYSAFFFMDMMIASTLFIIPTATSQSLFAEGSNSEAELKVHFKKAVKIVSIIVIPIIIIIFFFGKYILLAFGKEYSVDGFILLKFLSVSGVFFSINEVGGIILKIKCKIKLMILLSLVNTTIILSLSIILIKLTSLGIVGIGIGWIAGQCTTAIIYLFLIKKFLY